MKRTFTFLLTALFLCVGTIVKAQVSSLESVDPTKCYSISTASRGGWAVNESGDKFVSTNDLGLTVDAADVKQQFAILSANAKDYYLYSVSAKKFVKRDRTLVAGVADAIAFADASSEGEGRVQVRFRDIASSYINLGGSKQMIIDGWSAVDGGNAVLIAEAGDFDATEALAMLSNVCTVTYEFTYEGEVKYTQETVVTPGDVYPDYTVTLPLGVSAEAKPEGEVQATETVEVELSVELPFVAAESYEAVVENGNWYHLKFHSSAKNYLYYDASVEYLDATKTAVDEANVDAYVWAFVGNPFDGFKVMNKLAGENMVLSSAVEPKGDKEFPKMVTADTITTGNLVWDLSASAHAENGFFMAYHGTNKRLNKQDNKVCYWLGGADSGSTFMVEIFKSEEQKLAELVEETQALVRGYYENGYIAEYGQKPVLGQYSMEGANALLEVLAAEDITLEALEQAIAAFEATKNVPVFTINGVIDYAAGMSIYENAEGGLNFKETDVADETMLWAFDMTETTVGVTEKVVVRNLATGNLFWGAASIKIAETSENIAEDGIFLFYTEGNKTEIHAQKNGQAVVRWGDKAATSGSAWKFTYVGTTVDLYDIDFTEVIEGTDWSDANAGEWPVIMNADLTETWNEGPSDWGLKNSTNYDATNGILTFEATEDRFVVDENGKRDTAAYLNQGVSFDAGRYRLTGKAYYKNSSNTEESYGYMVVGEHKIPVKAVTGDVVLGAEHEIVYEFTVEGEFQYGMLMPEYLNVGYACDFQNPGDVLVVGGFKIETIKDIVVPSVKENFLKAYQGDMMAGVYGFNYYAYDDVFMNFTTMLAEYNALLADVNTVADALYGEQKILKTKVQKVTKDMEDMVKSISEVTSFAASDEFWTVLSTAADNLKGVAESSAAYAAIDKAVKDVNDLASVTSADDLKARVAAVGEAVKMLPTAIALNQTEAALDAVGATVELTAAVAPEETADKAVVWSTSDETVAIVDENGKVTAVANGTASIIATTVNGLADTCKVSVTAEAVIEVTEVSLNTTWGELNEVGATLQLTATVTPENATEQAITWSSSHPDIVTVKDGLVTVVAAAMEQVEIKATAANGVSASCWLTVYVIEPGAVTGIKLNATWKDLEVKSGDTFQLVATVEPEDATDKTVTWSSSADFAVVDANGLVTFTGTPEDGGVVTITATASNGMTATCMLSVTFVDNADGIDNINADAETVIYDIHGRRVTEMTKGVYIVNGKKVIKK